MAACKAKRNSLIIKGVRRLSIVFFVCTLAMNALLAQLANNKPLRIELEAAKDSEDYNFIAVDKQGAYVFYESAATAKDSSTWIFIHYDTNLQQVSSLKILIKNSYKYKFVYYNQCQIFILFQEQSVNKNSAVKSCILTLHTKNNTIQIAELGIFPNRQVRNLVMMDATHGAVLLSDEKYDMVYYFNLDTQTAAPAELSEYPITVVHFIAVDTLLQQTLLGMVTEQNKQLYMGLYVTDYQGNMINRHSFPTKNDFFYNNAQLSIVDTGKYLIIGAFNTAENRASSHLHTGVYTLFYQNNTFTEPRIFNYIDLKIKDTITIKSSVKNNDNTADANLYSLPSLVFTNGKQFLFLTEVYYPEYHVTTSYNSYNPYTSFGNAPTYSNTFSGYRYVNANITVFDSTGNLLWNYYFPFKNLITFHLMQRLSASFIDNDILLYYPYNVNIMSTLVYNLETIEPITTITLETNFARDIIEYTRNARIEQWYNNSYISSGYQYIKNNTKSVKSKRYIFYLHKLIFR